MLTVCETQEDTEGGLVKSGGKVSGHELQVLVWSMDPGLHHGDVDCQEFTFGGPGRTGI